MAADTRRLYDEIPYPSYPSLKSHPDSCAVLATLHGVRPPPLEHCRVLELGCNRGDNLIPIAHALPGGFLLGIDLSERAVAEGRRAAEAAGLGNVEFRRGDVGAFAEEIGVFDYILVPGLHPALPAPVQDALIALCKRLLDRGGLIVISYAVYPGSYWITALRELLRYHVRDIAAPRERVAAARALLSFFAGSLSGDGDEYTALMKKKIGGLNAMDDGRLLHEILAEIHTPVYYHEFARQIAGHGLQLLCDMEVDHTLRRQTPPEVVAGLARLGGSGVASDQYLDFLYGPTIRSSLLCHAGAAAEPNCDAERIGALYLSSNARPEGRESDIRDAAPMKFTRGKFRVALDDPLTKAALLCLVEGWPRTRPFDELVRDALARLGRDPAAGAGPAEQGMLKDNLLKCFAVGVLAMHVHPPRAAFRLSEFPAASPVARAQARSQDRVTTLYHRSITVDQPHRRLLVRLDGTRDRRALLETAAELEAEGLLGAPPVPGTPAGPSLEHKLDILLTNLLNQALLIG